MGGKSQKSVNQYKYLGAVLNTELSDDRDNCDINSVQQTSCEPLFFRCSNAVNNVHFCSFCTPMYASQLWCNFRKSCMQRLRVTYNFGCRALYNLPWRASVSSHDSSSSMHRWHSYIRGIIKKKYVPVSRKMQKV